MNLFNLMPTLRYEAPRRINDQTWVVEYSSPEYQESMKALRWGQPRGYLVTWRSTTSKPHLYKWRKP